MVEGRTHKPVIQSSQCQSCNVCLRGCPAELIPEYRQEEESLRGALYSGRISAVSSTTNVPPLSPCQEACPIRQDTKGYVSLIARGKFREALEMIREVNPLPSVCGFICHHPCEEACLREEVDGPVPMRLLKRFVAEHEREGNRPFRRPGKKKREKVLVIGSGPAGLTAANDLCLLGYEVTLVEALPVLGGMLAVGIPEFRLPRDVLNLEIEGVRELGVNMMVNHRFLLEGNGKPFSRKGFQATFLSVGAHRGMRLNIPGENRERVLSGVQFLREVNLGKALRVGRRVAVIGGGNVALDCARSATRLGAETVEIYYRRSRDEMPALREEVEEAVREGIEIHFLVSPVQVIGKGKRPAGVEFVRMRLGEPDASGRPRPIPIEDSVFKVKADTIISAVGQKIDSRGLRGLDARPDGTIRVDPETGATSMEGVFAGGDVVTGPGWAIDAIAAGKRGARSIDRFLS